MSRSYFPVLAPRTEAMTTRDGTRLVADIWQPDGVGPFPVLMMRQAYGRHIGTSLCYAPPEWYAAHGYIVVIQDVRGRGDSGGTFDLFENEATDGADAVTWAADLPGSNGRVGMFGFSFQGTNQLLAAGQHCPALRALAPAMLGWNLREDWAYENGAFALRANIGWATQLAAETARLAGDDDAQATLFAASRALDFSGPRPAWPRHEALLARYSHYARWRDTPSGDSYWDRISPSACLKDIVATAPATLLIGGWFDSHLPGTLSAYHALAPHVPARIIIGPWTHFPWDRRVGSLDFGPEAVTDIDQQQIAWFDHWLKDDPAVTPLSGASLFDMGANCWREFQSFPSESKAFSLYGSGRSAISMADGGLGETVSPGSVIATESVTLDTWRPAGPCGGTFGLPGGPVDRAQTDARSDTLTFTTEAFATPHLLAGAVRLEAEIATSMLSYDLHAVLSRVTEKGAAYPLAEGYATLEPGHVTVPMRATCCTLQPGEKLRLSLSPACFPCFPVNPGTGAQPWEASLADQNIMTLRLSRANSRLHLPMQPVASGPGKE
ncbi:MAG: CocE/NonD family hydrolase [Acetobacter sp.]|nr:CocE/NonD family hydrolase [Acetobacter sp.]MCH4061648.1 CocE/NonD family hydrolase [Acetobacter sp.]MCH4089503.1 CocE/NonD family hydrolase [Acetobacter sp.]MCI1294893.1 CocE/NonD family hydrolase [Acetobacter sp.]MCI1321361.1 CocE/NonD family hydrolase [Acetobacter sp.]